MVVALRRVGEIFLLAAVATPLMAAPPDGFAERAEAARQSFGAPGLAIAIVEDGEVTMARGFGVADIEDPLPVTADTSFVIGSVSKAFTSAAIAILVDDGLVDWDDKVIEHMPEFRLQDPWQTREMTIRDLLSHRAGLGYNQGDLLWWPRTNLTRAEVVKRLAHLTPEGRFRDEFRYNNTLYVVIAHLIERVSGQSWEDFVRTRIFDVVGMANATTQLYPVGSIERMARPHARLGRPFRGFGEVERLADDMMISQVGAPAGGVAASANDMARWMQVFLDQGDLPGEARLFSEGQTRELWRPAIFLRSSNLPPPLDQTLATFRSYALGWEVRDFHGERMITHNGYVMGSIAEIALLPERGIGIFLATNSEEGPLVTGLMYELLDHYLGRQSPDWPVEFQALHNQYIAHATNAIEPPDDVGPTLPLASYAGAYHDPWFGTIRIREENGTLTVHYPHWPGITATLEHWEHDTFRTRYNIRGLEPAFVRFSLNGAGGVEKVTMRKVFLFADTSYDYQHLNFIPVVEDD